MSVEPTALPSSTTRLPAACFGNASAPTPVMAKGYTNPVTIVSTTNRVTDGRSISFMPLSYTRRMPASSKSIALMPANGTMMPPTP
jgi:hypothetical protein